MPTESPTAWGEMHRVTPWLLPFEYLQHNPWDVLLQCRDYFENLHDYAATWEWSDLEGTWKRIPRDRQQRYATLLGSYRLQEGTLTASKFTNPDYASDMTLECVVDPVEHIKTAADTGVIDRVTIAEWHGEPESWVDQQPVAWDDRRERGRERAANAITVSQAWTDLSDADVQRALGLSESEFQALLNEATLVEIPERPAGKWKKYRSYSAEGEA